MGSDGGSSSGLERRQWGPGQWTAQGKGQTRSAAGTGGSVVSKARTGANRAQGTDTRHSKGLKAGDLGSAAGGARQERLGGGGGGGGGWVNRIGMKMNGSSLPPFIKQLDN